MNAQSEIDIHRQRVTAAECSKGISSNKIYDMVERIILNANLKGRILDYGAGVGHLTRRLLALDCLEAIAAAERQKRKFRYTGPAQLSVR
jgi:hypothetical protein